MLIGSVHNNKKFDNLLAIRVGNELIRHQTHVKKYLGLIVDDTLKWDLHIDYISKKNQKEYWCHETCQILCSERITCNVYINTC